MSKGNSQKCRLLLEGREVPFISANLICQVGQPLQAVIDLVPLQVIKFIKPKTQVHIFVQDTYNFGDSNFYLAFEGEVVGRAMRKMHDSRSFQITAVDYSGYWDEAKAYSYNPNFLTGKLGEIVEGGQAPATEAKQQGATTLTTSSTTNSIMIGILTKALHGQDTDLIDGVANVFRALSQVNLFYNAAWTRLRINDRVRVYSGGNVKKFLQDLSMDEFLQTYTGKQGGMTSLREMLINVMQLIFHDFISVPFPSLVPSIQNGTNVGNTIGNFLFVPDGYPLPPPKCNVIFPNYVRSFEFVDDFRATPTRFSFRASFPGFSEDVGVNVKTYPMQYYPDSFKDYMFNTATETDAEYYSLLGTSTLLLDPATGRSYGDLYGDDLSYGASAGAGGKNAVGGVSVSPILRESDFLTNEESIKGIFLDTETFMPGMTTLASHNTAGDIRGFTQAIGTYLFYKKRFAARNATAQLMFHPFLVPGFNSIIVDDSDAGQSFIGKVQQIVHNLTHEGFSTTLQLGYARDFDEIDSLTGGSAEPPLPPWFDANLFGSIDQGAKLFNAETAYMVNTLKMLGPNAFDPVNAVPELAARNKIATQPVTTFNHMSGFYQSLLACDSVTDVDGEDTTGSQFVTMRGAAFYLTQKFKQLSDNPSAKDAFVTEYIQREIPNMASTMFFLGAVPEGTSLIIPDQFAKFVSVTPPAIFANRFDGVGFADQKILALRRSVIDTYRNLLITQRGFRG